MSSSDEWLLPGAKQDAQTIDGEWRAIGRPLIAGVQVKEMRHVPTGYGYLTEIWRRDWGLDDVAVDLWALTPRGSRRSSPHVSRLPR